MPSGLHIEAPTERQLVYLRGLCEERGIDPPLVVGSKEDCSAAIRAIIERTSLEAWDWDWWEGVPF
jgi:hypothetical protein